MVQGPTSCSLPLLGLVAWGGLTILHFLTSSTTAVDSLQPLPDFQHSHPDRHLLSEEKQADIGQEGEEGVEEWEEEQERRRNRVAGVCHKWEGLDGRVSYLVQSGRTCIYPQVDSKNFLYSSKHKLLYCKNAKVSQSK